MKEHDAPKTLRFLPSHLHGHSMIPDSHLFQERVIFSLETPLSLSTDIRKTLENQLGPDPCYVAKTGHGIQACTTHPRPGRSKELIDWGTQAASGIDLEMPDLKYLLLEMQTGNLRPSTTSLITQDSTRWFSLGYWEMHTVNVPTAEGCWTLKFHRYTLEKNIFISKKYGRKGSSVCTW